MFYAKAMYLGSQIPVCAEDENLDYYSYRLLGLRCIVCGEEVQLRKGYVNRPHFAHFKETGINQNKCDLRVTGYSSSWSSLTSEGKGQRRKLFQEHFINIIKRQNTSFHNNIQILKSQLSFNALKEITNKCRVCFDSKKQDLIRECRQFNTSINDQNHWINGLIASEAIDYLSIPTSISPLELLLHYSIYIACNQSKSDNWNIFISTIEPNIICEILKEVILKTNWPIAFENLHQHQNKTVIPLENSISNQNKDLINEKLVKTLGKYINSNQNIEPFKNGDLKKIKHPLRLKLQSLNINSFILKDVANVVGGKPRKSYRCDKTIAQVIDIVETSDEIFINYKLIYNSGIIDIEYYKNLHREISYFLKKNKNQIGQKITFNLTNWKEICKLIHDEELIKAKKQQHIVEEQKIGKSRKKSKLKQRRKRQIVQKEQRKQQLEIIISEIQNIINSQDNLIHNEQVKKIIAQIKIIGDPEDPVVKIASYILCIYNKNGEQKIKCPICKISMNKENLLRHLKKIHINYGHYECPSAKLFEIISEIL
ncbi:hypothetical protein [Nodularia chucula]|uniref:competence protein CoiA family protein n=1 Tax=Nodularia chucula TaxID=3093667 RepID=UPI0039C6B570